MLRRLSALLLEIVRLASAPEQAVSATRVTQVSRRDCGCGTVAWTLIVWEMHAAMRVWLVQGTHAVEGW